ncbi:uncharacterized protein [Eleutherodactylus coqui]|uniref:uncharacterized protein isoform X2 n=1 Tax=Eleutherodactylus coqui TaxID=57060 RepID=UPI003462BCAB
MEKPGENQSSESQSSDDLAAGTRTPTNQPSLMPAAGQQPSLLPLGSLQPLLILSAGQNVTTLSGARFNVVPLGNNVSILQGNSLRLPVVRTEGHRSLTGRRASAKPTTSQARNLQPRIVRLGGPQTSAVQIGASVQTVGLQTQSSLGFQPSTVHIRPTGQPIVLLPQTFQPTASQTLSNLASVVQSYGRLPVSYGLSRPTTLAKQVSRPNSDSECKLVTYTDVTCSPKLKHNCTSTVSVSKSIGTQVNIPMRHRSQGVQCGNSNFRTLQTLQESSTQEERTAQSSQDNDPTLQRSVTFAQEMEPVGYELPAHDLWQADNLFLQDLLRIQRHRYVSYEPGQIQFDEVAIYFSKDEWEYLNEDDKDLYVEMMVKNYRTLHSLDSKSVKIVKSDEENYNLHKFSENLRKSIDDFLDFCMQQTETVMSEDATDRSASGQFCQGNPLLGPKPAIDEKPFRCFRCDRRFTRFCGLLLHQKSHPFENGFSCLLCSMTFKSAKVLLKHELIHTGEKPFICARCGKRYSTQQMLDNHLGGRLKKKNPYTCPTCGKRFAKRYILRRHELVHDQHKPYVCSYCGAGFTEEDNWNEHQRIHMEDEMQ